MRISVNPEQELVASRAYANCASRSPLSIGMIADRMTEEEILAAYPDLERQDIHEALRYAADAVRERELPLAIP